MARRETLEMSCFRLCNDAVRFVPLHLHCSPESPPLQVHHGLQKLEELVSNINDIIENRFERRQKHEQLVGPLATYPAAVIPIDRSSG